MATFPHVLCSIRFGDHAEQDDSAYLRSEVERGIARQRRNQADTRVSVPCTLLFKSKADADAWRTWFGYEGGGWFDFTLPRTGAVVPARVVGGNIGTLKPRSPDWEWSERAVVLEYIRPGFVQLPPGLHSVNPARVLSVQRNSTATYVDDAGLLQTAAANVARYQSGLMLVEGEATNLIHYSAAYGSGAYTFNTMTVQDGAVPGPAGLGNASVTTATGTDPFLCQVVDVVGGVTYTLSAWIKGIGTTVGKNALFLPWFTGTATGPFLWLEFPIPAEFTRVNFQFTPATSGNMQIRMDLPQAPEAAIGEQVAITGWQLEAGNGPTSYIPTTTAPATRAADLITVAA